MITKDTHAPSNAERYSVWLVKTANLRAQAAQPRAPTSTEILVAAAVAYCRRRGYSADLERRFAEVALRWVRCGASRATAISRAKARVELLVAVYGKEWRQKEERQ